MTYERNSVASPTDDRRQSIIDELLDWAIVTGRPLPMPAEAIAVLELAGWLVDLNSGSVLEAEPIMSQRVSLSPHGRARVSELRRQKETVTL